MLPTIPGHFSTGPPNGLPVLWRSFHTPGVVPKGSRRCCRAPLLPARRQAHLVASGIFCNGRHRQPGGMVVTYGDSVVLDPKMIPDPWSKNDPKVIQVSTGVDHLDEATIPVAKAMCGTPSLHRLSRSSLSRASTAAVQDSAPLNSSSCTGHPALRCSKCVAHPDVMPQDPQGQGIGVMAHMAMGQNWVPKNRMVLGVLRGWNVDHPEKTNPFWKLGRHAQHSFDLVATSMLHSTFSVPKIQIHPES